MSVKLKRAIDNYHLQFDRYGDNLKNFSGAEHHKKVWHIFTI